MILDENQQLSTDKEDLKKQVDEAYAKIAELQEVVKNDEVEIDDLVQQLKITHETRCAICKQPGVLYMCEKCPRVYHNKCYKTPIEGKFICYHCGGGYNLRSGKG